ncbi:hypothetical protein SE956_19355 [Escherichia coli]|nr:hypothetical protein [Escherichia coli]
MDVVVGHGQNDFEELEMNSGIKVFAGASDITQITTSTILDDSVPKNQPLYMGLGICSNIHLMDRLDKILNLELMILKR